MVSRLAPTGMPACQASDNLLRYQAHQAHGQNWRRNLFLRAPMGALQTFGPLRVHDIIAIIPIETAWLILHIFPQIHFFTLYGSFFPMIQLLFFVVSLYDQAR